MDAVYNRKAVVVPGGEQPLDTDFTWETLCYFRAYLAYVLVASWAWQVARQSWPDVQPDSPVQLASSKSLTPEQRRRLYTTVILFVYYIFGEGFWLVPQPIVAWASLVFDDIGFSVDVWQAVLSTLTTCATYLVVYYSAWMVTGMWCRIEWQRHGQSDV